MSKLRVLDLFSGIGGFSLGLERTGGFEAVAFCEIEPYCRAVLAKHWPGVPCYDDVRELTASRLAADGIAVDVICGGFPCQDISIGGKGEGLAGERSGLWSEYARLIGSIRPRFVIVENVPGLLSLGMGAVLGDLSALGYDAVWDCVPASAVGAHHRRDRVWLVAYARGEQHEGDSAALGWPVTAELPYSDTDAAPMLGSAVQWREPNRDRQRAEALANPSRARLPHDRRSAAAEGLDWHGAADGDCWSGERGDDWSAEPDVGRVAHGVPAELDRGHHGKEEHASEEGAKGDGGNIVMPGVRSAGTAGAPSPGLLEAGHSRGAVPAVPCQSGPAGRNPANENSARLRSLREGIPAGAQQEARPVQPGMQVGRWPHERGEALGAVWREEPDVGRVAVGVANRVDRLRALGNAVVPQIPELIGYAILEAQNTSVAAVVAGGRETP